MKVLVCEGNGDYDASSIASFFSGEKVADVIKNHVRESEIGTFLRMDNDGEAEEIEVKVRELHDHEGRTSRNVIETAKMFRALYDTDHANIWFEGEYF